MRCIFVLCALVLAGCGAPKQQYSTEALAEQKQRARVDLAKQRDRENKVFREKLRNLYVSEHPELSPDVRKAILKEKIKVGMTEWQVVAAYSMWEYTSDPKVAVYKAVGAAPLWNLLDRRQTGTGQTRQEQWALQQGKKAQFLYFEIGKLTVLKDVRD